MSEVHIVFAMTNYEGGSPLRAFTEKGDAEAFLGVCNEHARKKPRCPSTGDDEAWDAFNAADDAWKAAAPSAASTYCDYFAVISVPLAPTAGKL